MAAEKNISLAQGYISNTLGAIYAANDKVRVSIGLFRIVNESSVTRTLFLRFHKSVSTSLLPTSILLGPGYMLDVLDSGEVINMESGDYIEASCDSAGVLAYLITGKEESV